MTLLGYADRRVARPGDVVTVMVSCDAEAVSAELFQLIDGSPDPLVDPAPTERLNPPLVVHGGGKLQRSVVGSRADLPLPIDWNAGGTTLIRCWVYPTTAGIPGGNPDTDSSENVRMAGRLHIRRTTASGDPGHRARRRDCEPRLSLSA